METMKVRESVREFVREKLQTQSIILLRNRLSFAEDPHVSLFDTERHEVICLGYDTQTNTFYARKIYVGHLYYSPTPDCVLSGMISGTTTIPWNCGGYAYEYLQAVADYFGIRFEVSKFLDNQNCYN